MNEKRSGNEVCVKYQNDIRVTSTLEDLRHLVEDNGFSSLLAEIDEEIRKLRENRFYLVVLGQFKRGKTTFLNALLGEELLPVGVLPLTAVVTLISYGARRSFHVILANGQRIEIKPSEIADYVTELGNPDNHRNVRYVEIEHPAEFLRDGLVLVDTPGIGSLYLHNTKTTQDFIPKVDAAILTLSSDPPITLTEAEFLDEVIKGVGRIFVVLNKTDLLTESELNQTLGYTRSVLKDKLKSGSTEIFAVSSLLALLARKTGQPDLLDRSGIGAFETALRSFLEREKQDVFLQRTTRRAYNLVSRARFDAELKLRTIEIPLVELESKILEFERHGKTLQEDREHFAYLLRGEMKSLEKWIDAELRELADTEKDQLSELLPLWASELRGSTFSALLMALETKLAERLVGDIEAWRPRHEEELLHRYDRIVKQYVQKTNELIARVLQLSADLFNTQMQLFSENDPLEWQQRFYYRVADQPEFLKIDFLRMISPFLPGRFLRRRVVQRVLATVDMKVERNCGSLKYEYTYSLQESYRGFQVELDRKLDGVISEIKTILEKSAERRSSGQENLEPIRKQFTMRLREIDLLHAGLEIES
jgi:GTPase SAR1 family protein